MGEFLSDRIDCPVQYALVTVLRDVADLVRIELAYARPLWSEGSGDDLYRWL
jgi:hypothetical protein